MALIKTFLKNTANEVVVKVAGAGGATAITVKNVSEEPIVGPTQGISILAARLNGELDNTVYLTRGAERVLTLTTNASDMLAFDGQEFAPENVNNTDTIYINQVGSGHTELYLRLRKAYGYDIAGGEIPPTDRSILKSSNILIVYDPNSVKGMYGTDVNPADIAISITAQETSLGFTATTIATYSAFLALTDEQVAQYAHIWDVGYDTLIPAEVEDKYQTYLESGGAIFLLGENGYFVERDGEITNFITNMGGGTVTASPQTTGVISATIDPEFLVTNDTATVTFDNVGRFGSYGSGTPMASSGNGVHAAVWKTGSLTNTPEAAIAVVLDINFLISPIQNDFIDNVSIVLNQK